MILRVGDVFLCLDEELATRLTELIAADCGATAR